MRSTQFSQFWSSIQLGSLPLMHLLREEKKHQWVRFYSLPEGKRYPSNLDEENEILKRYNSIAEAIFLKKEPLWLVSGVDDDKSSKNQIAKFLAMDFKSTGSKSYIDSDGDKIRNRFFYKQDNWENGEFNNLFSLVIHEKVSPILFVTKKLQLFSVYDGGMDVILPNADQLDRIKHQFEQWRSPLSSGL